MSQITIYLEAEVSELVKEAAKAAGVSRSRWIAEAIRSRVRSEWPAAVRALAGAWPDFPSLEEIRSNQGVDAPRERL
jgi:Ribbon-helix-helix protein, copG family